MTTKTTKSHMKQNIWSNSHSPKGNPDKANLHFRLVVSK